MNDDRSAVGAGANVFQLLHRAEQRAKWLFAREASSVDLTLRQTAILQAVKDGGTIIQSDIVQRTGIDRSTVTELMGRLNARGLVTRTRSRRDARAYLVTLTGLGEDLLKQADAASVRAAELFINQLPAAERARFVENLHAAAGVNFDDADPAGTTSTDLA